jgi:hypothetical protein
LQSFPHLQNLPPGPLCYHKHSIPSPQRADPTLPSDSPTRVPSRPRRCHMPNGNPARHKNLSSLSSGSSSSRRSS